MLFNVFLGSPEALSSGAAIRSACAALSRQWRRAYNFIPSRPNRADVLSRQRNVDAAAASVPLFWRQLDPERENLFHPRTAISPVLLSYCKVDHACRAGYISANRAGAENAEPSFRHSSSTITRRTVSTSGHGRYSRLRVCGTRRNSAVPSMMNILSTTPWLTLAKRSTSVLARRRMGLALCPRIPHTLRRFGQIWNALTVLLCQW